MGVLAVATETVALIVAIASAAVSLISLVWQLVLYHLSGARLDVRLIPAVLTVQGHVMRGPERGWCREPPLKIGHSMNDGYVDLALIRIVNVGRSPISVSDIALDFGRSGWKLWWRHTVSGRPVPVHEGAADVAVVRLKAGETISVYMDHLPLVEHARRRTPSPRLVRASARPAGRRPVRSPWLRRWRVSKGREVGWPFSSPSRDLRAVREVFRVVYGRDVTKFYEAWIAVGALRIRSPNADAQEIADTLSGVLDVPGPAMDILLAGHAIERIYEDQDRDADGATAE